MRRMRPRRPVRERSKKVLRVMTRVEKQTAAIDLAHAPDFSLKTATVRPSSREVEGDGWTEILEPRVMQVLVALFEAGGKVVSRNDLVTRCWEGRIVGEDAINRTIAKLRRLSEMDGGRSFAIETIARVGYRLAMAVSPERPRPVVIPEYARPVAGKPNPLRYVLLRHRPTLACRKPLKWRRRPVRPMYDHVRRRNLWRQCYQIRPHP